ncbi:DUF202 domain-containing protein [Mangrovimonas sp. AS39]|uniref:DUF202 domain-containing protein n=1 Tax=Mangrovimonas TaxID=1211036 RepID=UPI000B289DC2|nr:MULTISPECIES: DUF202 domain-containing protein [Mangrovimonas]MCF1190383.1 DUF202 domain-containing protein [Mangrovimonas futianensis]MCF1193864.1 DUF202 domain-containing protein [Mangrovimonas futianensis]
MKPSVKNPLKIKEMKLLRFGRDFKPDEQIILRDYLAIERTRLANERTLLSYIRSSLYLLLAAMAFFQLKNYADFKYVAFISLGFSFIFFVIGIYRFILLKKSLKRLYYLSQSKQEQHDS